MTSPWNQDMVPNPKCEKALKLVKLKLLSLTAQRASSQCRKMRNSLINHFFVKSSNFHTVTEKSVVVVVSVIVVVIAIAIAVVIAVAEVAAAIALVAALVSVSFSTCKVQHSLEVTLLRRFAEF